MSLHIITPCLWFAHLAEDAAKFYISIFKNSKILSISHYGNEGFEVHGMPEGSVMTVVFELDGQKFTALNGGPLFTFSEAISFQISCQTQEEIDFYWTKLSDGGDKTAPQCGWLKDKYGLSWQIVPAVLETWMSQPEKSQKVMKAFMPMKKLDMKILQQAYESKD